MKNRRKIPIILYGVFSFVIGVLIISFTSAIICGFSSDDNLYMSTLRNWEESPIIDLELIYDSQIQCASHQTSVFLFHWPGTKEGCYISSINEVKIGTCQLSSLEGKNNSESQGTPIQSIPSRDIDMWRLQNSTTQAYDQTKFRLCATRLNGYNFKSNAPTNFVCLANEKWCGKTENNQKDINYGFCVPVSSKCPIKEIVISQINPNPKIYEGIVNNNELVNNLQIFVNREGPSKYPMTDFLISEGKSTYQDNSNDSSINQNYLLNQIDILPSELDISYLKTNITMREKEFFEVNKLSDILQALPTFYYSNEQFHLYTRSYTGLKMECRDKINQFYEKSDLLKKIKSMANLIFILCFIYSAILLFFESWIGYYLNKYSLGVIIFQKNVNIFLKLFYILKYLLYLVINVILIVQTSYSYQINYFIKDTIEKQCLDKGNDFYSYLFNGSVKELSVGILICLSLHIIAEPNIFYFLNKCFCKKLQIKMAQSISNSNSNTKVKSNKDLHVIIEIQENEENQLEQVENKIKNKAIIENDQEIKVEIQDEQYQQQQQKQQISQNKSIRKTENKKNNNKIKSNTNTNIALPLSQEFGHIKRAISYKK